MIIKLIFCTFYFALNCLCSRGDVVSLEKKYPEIKMEVHPFAQSRKAKLIKFSEIGDTIADYYATLLASKEASDAKLKEGDEQFPDLTGSIGVVIYAKNTKSNKYVSVFIGLDDKYQILDKGANPELKNEFARYIKKWCDDAKKISDSK